MVCSILFPDLIPHQLLPEGTDFSVMGCVLGGVVVGGEAPPSPLPTTPTASINGGNQLFKTGQGDKVLH